MNHDFSSIISLFTFCLDGMSMHESGILKSAAIEMWGSTCDLSFNDDSFVNVGTFACVALRHHLGGFFSSMNMNYLSPSFLVNFG